MGCFKCVSPYAYPGLQGGPFNSIPSEWAPTGVVIDTVCHVLNSSGREVRIYANSFRKFPCERIGRDDLMQPRAETLIRDARAMCAHFIYYRCRWKASPMRWPEGYTFDHIGQLLGCNRSTAMRIVNYASRILATDVVFKALYDEFEKALAAQGFAVQQVATKTQHAKRAA